MPGQSSCLAVITARNEAAYLEYLLPAIIADGVEVAVIDHESRDGTADIARSHLGSGVVSVDRLSFDGTFAVEEQLTAQQRIIQESRHDWVMHLDADEWMQTRTGAPLAAWLADVPERFLTVNFDEFVFLPEPGTDALGSDFRQTVTRYYFFEPRPMRLQRVWRNHRGIENVKSGGHGVNVPMHAIYPETQNLRHYVALSFSHAWAKRANRHYPAEEISRQWHGNRLSMRSLRPVLAILNTLPRVKPWNSPDLDRSQPRTTHYWEWPSEPVEPAGPIG